MDAAKIVDRITGAVALATMVDRQTLDMVIEQLSPMYGTSVEDEERIINQFIEFLKRFKNDPENWD
jgi:hypothetical protein